MAFYDAVLSALGIRPQKNSAPPATYSRNTPAERALLALPARKSGPAPLAILSDESVYIRQTNSLLFTKLPVELRDMVWELLLGHHTIHLFWYNRNKLRGFICAQQASRPKECISMQHAANRPRRFMPSSASQISEHSIDQNKGFMPLLLTCRAVLVFPARNSYFDQELSIITADN